MAAVWPDGHCHLAASPLNENIALYRFFAGIGTAAALFAYLTEIDSIGD